MTPNTRFVSPDPEGGWDVKKPGALHQSGDDLFSRSGTHVAKLKGKKAYGPDGRYVGTLVVL